jgi:hypothetical protein
MKTKFYAVQVEMLVEVDDKDRAIEIVKKRIFTEVQEKYPEFHNFTVGKAERVKESELC